MNQVQRLKTVQSIPCNVQVMLTIKDTAQGFYKESSGIGDQDTCFSHLHTPGEFIESFVFLCYPRCCTLVEAIRENSPFVAVFEKEGNGDKEEVPRLKNDPRHNLTLSPGIRRKIAKALSAHGMIQKGDRILVGLSGGKDSLLLLSALRELQQTGPLEFGLAAATIDITGGGSGFEKLSEYCAGLGLPYEILGYPILDIIHDREERSPCSLCANLRNGILFGHAAEKGYNSVALGHNLDDVVETVLLNLFLAGRFKCFAPRSWRSRKKIWAIRPLVYLSEDAISQEARRLSLPVAEKKCPYDGNTRRQEMKGLLDLLEPRFPSLKSQIFHALLHVKKDDIWGLEEES